MRKETWLIILLLLAVLFSSFLAACSLAGQGGASGKALVEQRCSTCHNLELIKVSKYTPVQWEGLVNRMIGRGMTLTSTEKTAVVEYLAKTYKP